MPPLIDREQARPEADQSIDLGGEIAGLAALGRQH